MRNQRIKLIIISIFVLFGIIVGTVSATFAENNIYGLLSQWYKKKATEAEAEIQEEVEEELAIQKLRLQSEIQLQMEESSKNLDDFKNNKIEEYRSNIVDYADRLVANLEIPDEEDRDQIEGKLNEILNSAQEAMEQLIDSYTPPTPIYEPSQDQIILERPKDNQEIPNEGEEEFYENGKNVEETELEEAEPEESLEEGIIIENLQREESIDDESIRKERDEENKESNHESKTEN